MQLLFTLLGALVLGGLNDPVLPIDSTHVPGTALQFTYITGLGACSSVCTVCTVCLMECSEYYLMHCSPEILDANEQPSQCV